jgi:hypothetical protein
MPASRKPSSKQAAKDAARADMQLAIEAPVVRARHNPGVPWSQAVAVAILGRIADGESVRKICESEGMPSSRAVWDWLGDSGKMVGDELFSSAYARAKAIGLEIRADELLEIADDTAGDLIVSEDGTTRVDHEAINRAKLRIDTRKWLLERLASQKYSPTAIVKHTGSIGVAVEMDEAHAVRVARAIIDGAQGDEPK